MQTIWRGRAAVLAVVFTLASVATAQAAVTPGAPAPEISGRELTSGEQVTLSEMRGKWVFVDFWASWCKPCGAALPSVVGLHREMSSNPNFEILGVSLDSEASLGVLRKVVKKGGVTYPVVYTSDAGDAISKSWGVNSIPSTFLIDPQGRIAGANIEVGQVRGLIERGGNSPRGEDRLANRNTSANPAPARYDTVPARQPSALSANYNVKPTQVKCTEQLLPSQSGLQGGHDLEVTMQLGTSGPRLRNYRMFLRATKRGPGGKQVDANWRYDINLLLDPKNRYTPYFIEILDSSDPAKALGYPAPELTAAIDLERGICQLIVPLSTDTLKLNYAVALYEDPAYAAR